MRLKQRLLKVHFYLVTFALANLIFKLLFSIGFHQNIIFLAKIIVYATGLILFFITIRPFKKKSLYFSIYLLSPILIFISWLADGILGAILASIYFAIFYPPNKVFKDGDYIIYGKFNGFLGACCTYDIVHNQLWILQRNLDELRITEKHDFTNSHIRVTNNRGYLKIHMEVYDAFDKPTRQVDTTIVFGIK